MGKLYELTNKRKSKKGLCSFAQPFALGEVMELTDNIKSLKGIGDKTAELFAKEGIYTVKDLLNFFPRTYIEIPKMSNICDLRAATSVIIRGKITSSPRIFSSKGKNVIMFPFSDQSGSIQVSFFGMPYLKKMLVLGREMILYGRIVLKNGRMILSQPKILSEEDYQKQAGSLMPIYHVTKGLTTSKIQKLIALILEENINLMEYLPENILNEYSLISANEALRKIHIPDSFDSLTRARSRLAFDEFYLFLLRLQILKMEQVDKPVSAKIIRSDKTEKLLKELPYQLTNGQMTALEDIENDMASGYQMNRLVQGDVGCGKTILCFLAMLNSISAGYQAALMAPTEVLATQHYQNIVDLNEKYNLSINPILLIGSMTAKQKKEAKELIGSGKADFIIGTHAVIQDNVEFNNLGMVVCDEQHRFGVGQRMKLLNKGNNTHTLVMSATPIPRTLGLILYGDLDVSVIKELPANRKPIKNTVVGPDYRPKLYKFIEKQISEGRQAYIICPMVEESEEIDAENVMDYSQELRSIFPPYVQIEALHGKMKPKEKDEIMERFTKCETHILVSTTVVEVGVNVPNATVMMIENSERFGLSQLHQLRGRVGRGAEQSYCIFLIGNDSKKAQDRLSIMAKTNDGFEIANEDLKQRGPGDFFGLRQSGLPGFRIADIYSDSIILEQVKSILERQSRLEADKLKLLFEKISTREGYDFMDLHDICL